MSILLPILIPLLSVPIIGLSGVFFPKSPNIRDGVSITTSLLLFLCVVQLVTADISSSVTLANLAPGLSLTFSLEPLGMMFMLVASSLWIITTLYAIGYMRGNHEKHQTRFFMFFAVSMSGVMALAMADNLLTLFVFYEVLTFATYPLVTHKRNAAAQRGGRIYLSILLTTSVLFFLSAIIWTYAITGTTDFVLGGILPADQSRPSLILLFTLFAFGIGKAALMPFHKWLPNAMVAPTPVSALLHAVAVVKAGVFSIIKIATYIFGTQFLNDMNITQFVLYVSLFTIVSSSVIALKQDNLKARLAYSTVGQLSYVIAGVALANQMGLLGGSLQIVFHAFAKITLFFCAGAIYTQTKKTHISQLDGLGKYMPITFAAFFVASLGIIGLPPLGGTWAKWFLIQGSLETGSMIAFGALLLSSLLNIAYLLEIPVRGFLMPQSQEDKQHYLTHSGSTEAPLACVIPLAITGLMSIALFFYVEPLVAFITPIIK